MSTKKESVPKVATLEGAKKEWVELSEKFTEWFNKHCIDGKCPMCGHGNFATTKDLSHLICNPDTILPVITLVCKKCGYVSLISYMHIRTELLKDTTHA